MKKFFLGADNNSKLREICSGKRCGCRFQIADRLDMGYRIEPFYRWCMESPLTDAGSFGADRRFLSLRRRE